ncbi:MAG: STAS domain-containing protein [Gammaproteobacteria bacterium]|nr:STAS domain-containing protein [Gammaproteobacteria bacterium]
MLELVRAGGNYRLVGDLTVHSARQGYENSPEFTGPVCQMDLERVRDLDSAGLALLVYWYNRAAGSSCRLEFLNVPDKLAQIAEMGGLGAIFGVTGDG